MKNRLNKTHRAFNVYLNGKGIDKVFYSPGANVDREEVRRSLIDHDGYNGAITVLEEHSRGRA